MKTRLTNGGMVRQALGQRFAGAAALTCKSVSPVGSLSLAHGPSAVDASASSRLLFKSRMSFCAVQAKEVHAF